MPHYFTPQEANDALPEIRALVEALVRRREAQRRIVAERLALVEKIAGNGGGIDAQVLADLEADEERERVAIARCVNAIHSRGAIVKDADEGLVDFPALHDGHEILLCWHLGEDAVTQWHGLEDGFPGRRPIDF